MPKHIFISYSSKDQKAAFEICSQLELAGIACWIAPRDVTPGKDYGEEIITAIEATHIMVLVLSGDSNASIHVKHEVERAVSKQKVVIPFRIAEIQPSKALEFYISSAHWIDAYVPPLDIKVRLLADTIRTMLGLPAPAAAPDQDPTSQKPAPAPVPSGQPTPSTVTSKTEPLPSVLYTTSEPNRGATEEPKTLPVKPPLPVAEWVSDPQIRKIVVGAVDKVEFNGYHGTDLNSETIWQNNLAVYKGREIPDLCLFIEQNGDIPKRWCATLLLFRSLSVREGWPYMAQALPYCSKALISLRWDNWIVTAKGMVTTFISNARASREEKWTFLTETLKQISSGERFVSRLMMFIPPGKKEQTIEILLESLERETGSGYETTQALRSLQAFSYKPRLREILISHLTNYSVVNDIAWLLAEWQDKEAVPYLYEAVENFRNSAGGVSGVLMALYELQGAEAVPYIGEVLLDTSLPNQIGILRSIDRLGGPALRESVQQLAEMVFDQNLKQLVDNYLAKTEPVVK